MSTLDPAVILLANIVTSVSQHDEVSAENERKAVQAQLSNERLISSNLRNELEKQMEIRSMEKNELEIEKVGQILFVRMSSGWQFLKLYHVSYCDIGEASKTMETARKITGII